MAFPLCASSAHKRYKKSPNTWGKAKQWTGSPVALNLSSPSSPDKATEKAAPIVSGEELEVLLTEWDTPLVLDAYASKF